MSGFFRGPVPDYAANVMFCAQAQGMSTAEDLQGRWQGVLARHGGSPQLWREYLRWQRGQYGMFAVSRMHTSYQDAVQVQPLLQPC